MCVLGHNAQRRASARVRVNSHFGLFPEATRAAAESLPIHRSGCTWPRTTNAPDPLTPGRGLLVLALAIARQ